MVCGRMTATNVIQPSFAAGEVGPALYGRVDLAKYRTGLALARNMIIEYQGGASNRPGTEYIMRSLTPGDGPPPRLIPFNFNAQQTYILEFGDFYIRIIMDGGYITETPKNIVDITADETEGWQEDAVQSNAFSEATNTTLIEVTAHGWSNGDWIFVTDITGIPHSFQQNAFQEDAFATLIEGPSNLNGRFFIIGDVTANTFVVTTLDGATVPLDFPYISGGTAARIYTTDSPYAIEDLRLLKFTQSNDVMTICHPDYPPYDLTRSDHDAWTFTEVDFSIPDIDPPTGLTGTPTAVGTVQFGYVVTAISKTTKEESLPSERELVDSINIATTAGSIKLTWDVVTDADYYNVYKAHVSPQEDVPLGTTYGFAGSTFGLEFKDGNITPDFTRTPPIHYNPFAPGAITGLTVTAGGSGYNASTTVSIAGGGGSGASFVPIVIGGEVKGFIKVNGGEGYSAPATATISGAGTGATADVTVGPTTGTYPSVVTYFQQRKVFGATANSPITLYGTKPGAFTNMDYSQPTNAGDSFEYPLYSNQANPIKSMVPMPSGLVVLTGTEAWQLTGGQNVAVTATEAVAQPQSFNGTSDVPPLKIGYEILYVQAKGAVVRDLSYNFFANIYTGTDVSVLASHLFEGYEIYEWTWAEEPHKIIVAIRSDGTALCFTFLKEQEVYAWSTWDTQGLFESVASVQEGIEDAIYLVTNRYVSGAWRRSIERLHSRRMPGGVVDAWFLDAALGYSLEYPAATLSVSATTGSVVLNTDVLAFSEDDVEKIVWTNGGKIRLSGYTSGTQVAGTVLTTLTDVVKGTTRPRPMAEGAWGMGHDIDELVGLEHLAGLTAGALADGGVEEEQTITTIGGATLTNEASKIVIGLPYLAQMQTLDIDVGEPTVQGKWKKISQVSAKVKESRGWKVGPDFDHLYEIKQRNQSAHMGQPIPLVTTTELISIDPSWNVNGQLAFQQSYPLPMTILAVIPNLKVGDT